MPDTCHHIEKSHIIIYILDYGSAENLISRASEAVLHGLYAAVQLESQLRHDSNEIKHVDLSAPSLCLKHTANIDIAE